MTRRDLLTRLSAGAVAALANSLAPPAAAREDARRPALPGSPLPASDGPPAQVKVSAFPLEDVRLLRGPFLDAEQRDSTYLLALEPDRMLHNFRVNAGLEPKAPVYGGWESRGAVGGHPLSRPHARPLPQRGVAHVRVDRRRRA